MTTWTAAATAASADGRSIRRRDWDSWLKGKPLMWQLPAELDGHYRDRRYFPSDMDRAATDWEIK